ncbi:pantothenate transporter [Clohesyomyces aquaticus]|uniref:Pantothenate transporter n=1 Tax=Clohesyomyces aquaticus TaxID=1231657 RepID=A0A1Y1Y5S1_9PLEO|nr:pantothenate transporter [Clohesyomyces aquaticus]
MSPLPPQVAVIGAGISGVVAAAHLRREGVDVTVYERSKVAGGIWVYDERKPLEPEYPSPFPSIPGEDQQKDGSTGHVIEGNSEVVQLLHAPPGPCYSGLKNNVGTRLLETTLNPFPAGTPDFVSHQVLKNYIQDTAVTTGVHNITIYDTDVRRVWKDGEKWNLKAATLTHGPVEGLARKEIVQKFDSVVIASGHYHNPKVPDIPGLADWKRAWPDRVQHSKGYRKPEEVLGKNFLLIGGSVSATDIARELGPHAQTIYQSHRNGAFDLPPSLLPENAIRVDQILSFDAPPRREDSNSSSINGNRTEPVPATITLKSGRKLCDIHHVIICTGYHMTVPFLSHLHSLTQSHSANSLPEDVDEKLLVTDGTQFHNLHKDIFYIPDPSLIFIGVPFFTATFTLFEFQAMVIAKVVSGRAKLPAQEKMREEYRKRVGEKGYGKNFHSLKHREVEYVNEILGWVNEELRGKGEGELKGHSEVWMEAKEEQVERIKAMFAGKKPKKWTHYVWDTFDKPKEERWFMFKLDAALLTFASLGYFIKYLDQSNINSAFISGMKQHLSLYGNQLNNMQTCWTIGYVLGELPSNIILTRVRPSRWIPTMEVLWAVLTFSLSRANTAKQIYILRFFIGLAESTFYPGMQYIIGSWYRKEELAKRSCIFHTSAAIATMFSGYLMAAVYHLDGRHGFRGWQWLFIVDGVISLPIALAGYFFLPDVPEISKPFYLSEKEVAFAVQRMEAEGRQKRMPYTKTKVWKILTSWHIYALTLLYIFFNNGAAGAAPVFAQFLKHSKHPKYTVSQINTYPTTTSAVQVVSTLVYAWTSDGVFNGARWPAIVFGGVVNIVCYVSLAVWDIPVRWKWACLIVSGLGYGLSGLCMAYICTHDNEERAIAIASMHEMAYVIQAWLPLTVWQQVEAPEYRKGYITITCLSVCLIITALTIRVLHEAIAHSQESDGEDKSVEEEEVVVGKNPGGTKSI